ncbi:hypothetical protein ACFWOJ_30090 [Streptomyces sp. NPDC058439]
MVLDFLPGAPPRSRRACPGQAEEVAVQVVEVQDAGAGAWMRP